jgi:hypothetical protein
VDRPSHIPSLIYDLFWFIFKADDPTLKNAGIITKFSMFMTYIAFILRIILAIVFWKDSLDFENIVLGKKVDNTIRVIKA